MFAAVVSADAPLDGKTVDLSAMREPRAIEFAGASQRVMFVVARIDQSFDGEWRGIERLGGRFWIVGRIRFDGRKALAARLGKEADTLSDGLLCLHAYAAWGEGFLDHLAGDFCFALWDEAEGALIAVRDQLGVRSLFHAEAGSRRYVSDSLDWVARQPAVDTTLDDYWIADFLCARRSLDFHRTVYRAIARLPPAHALKVTQSGANTRRYWRLDIAEPLYLRDRRLYAECFRELVTTAIGERLPADGKVGVSMSGGLDSTTLAALAVAATGDRSRVVAECMHFERLMPDEEAHFSSVVARHLGIELKLPAIDDLTYDPSWRTRRLPFPEPSEAILSAECTLRLIQGTAAAAPIWLYGEGPDNALAFDRDAYLSWLRRRRDWPHLAEALMLYLRAKGFSGWASTARRYTSPEPPDPTSPDIPAWLDRGFVDRLNLRERMRDVDDIIDRSHGWHPRAVGSFKNPIWQGMFGELDSEEAMAPLVWRHPFLDLRVLEFMLSVPPVPWARGKFLIRQAMRDRLPEEILRRKKTPLVASPIAGPIAAHGLGAMPPGRRLDAYVDVDRLPAGPVPDDVLRSLVAAHALDHWIMYNRINAAKGSAASA